LRLVQFACLGLIALGLTAAAPKPAPKSPIDDPESVIVGTLVEGIEVGPGGPAWWAVSRGGHTVYVLGVMWSYPADKDWSHRTLDRHLRGARALLSPAVLGEGGGKVVDDSLPPGNWNDVSPEVRGRVAAAAAKLGKPAQRYFGRPPLVAGYLLVSDFREGMGLKTESLSYQVFGAAKQAAVDIRYAAVLSPDRYTKALSSATSEGSLACLQSALAEVEGGETPMREAVDGWAGGDLADALAAPRGMELCAFAVPGQADLRRAAIDAQVGAIAAVLDGESGARPTAHYVAMANLRTLVAADGVLDKLRKRGYQIRAPQR
jgi:hypothetical protein